MITLVICLLVLVVASAAVLREGLEGDSNKGATTGTVPHRTPTPRRERRPTPRRRLRARRVPPTPAPVAAGRSAEAPARPAAPAPEPARPAAAASPPAATKASSRPRPVVEAAPRAHRGRSGIALVVLAAGVGVLTAAAIGAAAVAMALALRSAVGA